MQIQILTGGIRKEKLPKRIKKVEAPGIEHMDESQSTLWSRSIALSFTGSAIQAYINESFWKVPEELKTREDEYRKALVETLARSFIHISKTQAQTLREIASLKKDVSYLHKDVSYLQDIVLAHISIEIPTPSLSDSPLHHSSSQPSPSLQHSPAPTVLLKSPKSDPSITLSPSLDLSPF